MWNWIPARLNLAGPSKEIDTYLFNGFNNVYVIIAIAFRLI